MLQWLLKVDNKPRPFQILLDAVGSPAYGLDKTLLFNFGSCAAACAARALVQKMAGRQVRRENREFSELYWGLYYLWYFDL